MVPTLSNLLGIPVVIFSSAIHHPIIFITPRVIQLSVPIFVAFTQYGPGHYSGICAADDQQPSTIVQQSPVLDDLQSSITSLSNY